MGIEEPAFGKVLEAAAEMLGGLMGVFRDYDTGQVAGDLGEYVSALPQWWGTYG